MSRRDNEREFYAGDTFNRGATMYFCSPDYDTDTCINLASASCLSNSTITTSACDLEGRIASLDCSVQGTSSDRYAVNSLSAATESFGNSLDNVIKSLQQLGKRVGVSIDSLGNIVSNQKMNFKVGAINRLQRADLNTLKGNW